jgi:deoxyribose-phosphate aldolase
MERINTLIDHTNLKMDATEKDIEKLCREALEYKFRGVCVNPLWVPFVFKYLKRTSVKTISVCDFPLGSSLTEIRKKEAEIIVKSGAEEIDLVMQISLLKSKKYRDIEKDIREIANIVHLYGKLKVIIEAPLLSDEEITKATKIAENAGADFIKSGTGTNGPVTTTQVIQIKGATWLPIKAAGGIKDTVRALELLKSGASVLGSSNSVEIIKGFVS